VSIAGYQIHKSSPYLSPIATSRSSSASVAAGTEGCPRHQSERGGISSIALVPKTARSPYVLFPTGTEPAVVGVRLWPIPELVSPQRILGALVSLKPSSIWTALLVHMESAQQPADSEKHPASICADDETESPAVSTW